MKAGVLALQGDFREHGRVLAEAGAVPVEVRTPQHLADVDCLVIPGGSRPPWASSPAPAGWSSRCGSARRRGCRSSARAPGMIVLARRVEGGEPLFDLIDITVRRNAYGRQVDSFEADLDVEGIDHPVRGVFIRAPRVEDLGPEVARPGDARGTPGRPGAREAPRGILPSRSWSARPRSTTTS